MRRSYLRCSAKFTVVFSHVPAHTDHAWNDEADRLAKEGETEATAHAEDDEEWQWEDTKVVYTHPPS